MNVSSHPAQVVTPNKAKEGGSHFQILENTQNHYSLLKFLVKTKQHFIDAFETEMWNSWVVSLPRMRNLQFKLKEKERSIL